MSRIMTVGASGFVGAHTVRRLCGDGHEVCGFAPALEPCLTAADASRMTFVPGDVTAPGAIDRAVSDFAPEIVVGLAAWGEGEGLMAAAKNNPDRARAVNAHGFRRLLEACRDRGVERVVWASTGAVFGNPRLYPPDGTAAENARPAPETDYGETKREAETIAREFRRDHGLAVTGLRLPLVFGPGLWYRGAGGRIVALFEAAARGGRAGFDVSPAPLDLVYVKDAARAFAFLVAFAGDLEPIYNLHAFAPTARALVETVRALAPDLVVEIGEAAPAHEFPVMRGERLRALGFAPAWGLRDACLDYLNDLRG